MVTTSSRLLVQAALVSAIVGGATGLVVAKWEVGDAANVPSHTRAPSRRAAVTTITSADFQVASQKEGTIDFGPVSWDPVTFVAPIASSASLPAPAASVVEPAPAASATALGPTGGESAEASTSGTPEMGTDPMMSVPPAEVAEPPTVRAPDDGSARTPAAPPALRFGPSYAAGAGRFATEPAPWAASAWTSNPNAGAGRFTSERTPATEWTEGPYQFFLFVPVQ